MNNDERQSFIELHIARRTAQDHRQRMLRLAILAELYAVHNLRVASALGLR